MFKIKKPLKIIRSMKLRIFLILITIGILPLIIFRIAIRGPIEDEMVNTKMERLMGQSNILKNHIISENYLEIKKSDSIDAELAQLSAMYDGRVLLVNQDFVIIKDTYVMDENKICVSPDAIKGYKG